MRKKRNLYRKLVGVPEGKRSLGRPNVGGWIILLDLSPFFVNSYNNRLLSLMNQVFLIPKRINEFVDSRH
jgi:hypothetical protein